MMGTQSKPVANALRPVGAVLNSLPVSAREKIYALSGWAEAIPSKSSARSARSTWPSG
jgi:hypothetical protein